ncbi:hypothetical protein AEA09_06260 [Lysinibacillus contaminans]|uniref:Uncharacterized protein n=1 Tax=Lysinibacillus contaminans TaxID=1293441 RepID=A0ABR5JZU9_9BACI|nr:hypothetical protein [Lysinibacillus contaminans]KOS68193.1 hypothetical protein AEA09_06260 [Lysinibacillus contaminans]
MKKTFKKLDKIQIVIASIGLLLAILGFTCDNLTEVAFILIFISLLITEVRDLRKDKKSIFPYLKIVMKILIIKLLIHNLLG